LDQFGFALALGSKHFDIAQQMGFISFGVLRRQQDGAPGEAGFDGIQGRDSAAFRGLGSRGQLGIGTVGGEATLADGLDRRHSW
jgi:hypothetical protein